MSELNIVYLNPTELKPYEGNARHHTPSDIDAIKASIRKFGFSDPIGIWGEDNVIVEGHGRQIAAVEMGLDSVPCIRLDHMTDDQRKAYALAHNKTAELSGWDFMQLEEELAALDISGWDMSEFGFENESELGKMQEITDTPYTGQGATEYSEEDFGDDKFQCECPRCGFKFNP